MVSIWLRAESTSDAVGAACSMTCRYFSVQSVHLFVCCIVVLAEPVFQQGAYQTRVGHPDRCVELAVG